MPLVLYLKNRHKLKSSKLYPMLLSRSCIVLHFTFRPVIHFVLMFVKVVKSVSRFIFFFFACGCLVVPAPFEEKTIFVL